MSGAEVWHAVSAVAGCADGSEMTVNCGKHPENKLAHALISACIQQVLPEKRFTVNNKILSVSSVGEAQHTGSMLLLQHLSKLLEVDSWLGAAQSLCVRWHSLHHTTSSICK